MSERARRKDLTDEYKRNRPEAGVYRIVNKETGRALLDSALNLGSVRGKLDFVRSTGTLGALDPRIRDDVRALGIDAFELEVLEVLETKPEMTERQLREDLKALEDLWRERLDQSQLY